MKRIRTDDVDVATLNTSEFTPVQSFSALCLHPLVLQSLTAHDFVKPSPVQAASIPVGIAGFDLIAQAKSGTGKTISFSSILLHKLCTLHDEKKTDLATTYGVILSPTREIAQQTFTVISRLAKNMPFLSIKCFIGGTAIENDISNLENCTVAVGTPGRMLCLMKKGELATDDVNTLIFDESDALLSGTIRETTKTIFNLLPSTCQFINFSATYSTRVLNEIISTNKSTRLLFLDKTVLKGVKQYKCILNETGTDFQLFKEKCKILSEIFKTIDFCQCIVFCNNKEYAESLDAYLRSAGWKSVFLGAGQLLGGREERQIDQTRRNEAIEALRTLSARIGVGTDLVSRGVDFESVNLVVQLGAARDAATYVHRVGRTGRYGTHGLAITVCSSDDTTQMEKIEKELGMTIETYTPGMEIPKETYSFEIEDASLKEKISATKNEEKRFKGINNDELSKCFQEVHEKRQKVEEERNKRKELRKNQTQKEQNTVTVQSDATTGATWSSLYPQGIPYMYATASYHQPWYGGLPLPSVAATQLDEKEWNAFLQRRAQAVKHLL